MNSKKVVKRKVGKVYRLVSDLTNKYTVYVWAKGKDGCYNSARKAVRGDFVIYLGKTKRSMCKIIWNEMICCVFDLNLSANNVNGDKNDCAAQHK